MRWQREARLKLGLRSLLYSNTRWDKFWVKVDIYGYLKMILEQLRSYRVTKNIVTLITSNIMHVFICIHFAKSHDKDSSIDSIVSASFVGNLSSAITSPGELARSIKLKSSIFTEQGYDISYTSRNNWTIIKKQVYSTQGVRDMFKGYQASVRDVICTVDFFSIGSQIDNKFDPYFDNQIAKILFSLATSGFLPHGLIIYLVLKCVQQAHFAENWQFGTNKPMTYRIVYQQIYPSQILKGFLIVYPPKGIRFSLGFMIKAMMIEKMNQQWVKYNKNLEIILRNVTKIEYDNSESIASAITQAHQKKNLAYKAEKDDFYPVKKEVRTEQKIYEHFNQAIKYFKALDLTTGLVKDYHKPTENSIAHGAIHLFHLAKRARVSKQLITAAICYL